MRLVYKRVKRKDKILRSFAEISNDIYKCLKYKGKKTEKSLRYLTIAHKKAAF